MIFRFFVLNFDKDSRKWQTLFSIMTIMGQKGCFFAHLVAAFLGTILAFPMVGIHLATGGFNE